MKQRKLALLLAAALALTLLGTAALAAEEPSDAPAVQAEQTEPVSGPEAQAAEQTATGEQSPAEEGEPSDGETDGTDGGSVVGVFRVDMLECCQPRHLLS